MPKTNILETKAQLDFTLAKDDVYIKLMRSFHESMEAMEKRHKKELEAKDKLIRHLRHSLKSSQHAPLTNWKETYK